MYQSEASNIPQQRFKCQMCNKPSLFQCSNCKSVYYCSQEHQLANWETHSKQCQQTSQTQLEEELNENDQNHDKQSSIKKSSTSNIIPLSAMSSSSAQNKKVEGTSHQQQFKLNMKLLEELHSLRDTELQQILVSFSQNQYSAAIYNCARLSQISSQIYEHNRLQNMKQGVCCDFEDYANCTIDCLLAVRCQIKLDKIQAARDIMVNLLPKLIDKSNCALSNICHKMQHDNLLEHEKIEEKKRAQHYMKIGCEVFSCLAAMFSSMGDQHHAEQMYVQYTIWVESCFGAHSQITGNCYFLIGVFYYENQQYTKAMACFKRAAKIRQFQSINVNSNNSNSNVNVIVNMPKEEENEGYADCLYNMGLVYKRQKKLFKAMRCLEQACAIRKRLIGQASLPVADVYEIQGKVLFSIGDYKACLQKLHDCYAIRTKILTNASHPSIIKVSLLILHLQNAVTQNLQEKAHQNIQNTINTQTLLNKDNITPLQQQQQLQQHSYSHSISNSNKGVFNKANQIDNNIKNNNDNIKNMSLLADSQQFSSDEKDSHQNNLNLNLDSGSFLQDNLHNIDEQEFLADLSNQDRIGV